MTKANLNWKTVAITLGAVAGIIIIWLLVEDEKKRKKLIELQREIDENENFNIEVKNRLKELIQNNKEIDPKISNELGHIAALIEIQQETKAIATLAKIIENLLKELYKGDSTLKDKVRQKNRKNITFEDYLDYAKEKGVISKEDYHLLAVMKIIRNEESHELDIKKEKSRVIASFIAGFGIILGLCQLIKIKTSTAIVQNTVKEM
jgi:hypothetical protein